MRYRFCKEIKKLIAYAILILKLLILVCDYAQLLQPYFKLNFHNYLFLLLRILFSKKERNLETKK